IRIEVNGGSGILIDETGHGGILTSNPLVDLHVAGEVAAQRVTLPYSDGSDPLRTLTWHLDNTANIMRIFEQPNLLTSGSVRMVIKSGGNVGIGTVDPTAKLHIGGTAGVDGIKFPDGTVQTTAASGTNICYCVRIWCSD